MNLFATHRFADFVGKHTILAAGALAGALLLSGCSSSNSSDSSSSSYTGTVSAPGGSVAFNAPNGVEKMLAEIVGGKQAHAAISGVSNVGAGVTVELIEVDADGNKVGDTIASTTTEADGSYTLDVPSTYGSGQSFAPGSKFVIRATGTSESLDTRVVDTSNDVDPVTDATSDLITDNVTDLATLTTEEIESLNESVESVSQDVDSSGLSADELSSALKTEASDDEAIANQVAASSAAGAICGNVKDSGGNNLENIVMVVRDYSDWVTRNKIKTDANGDFCLNVPDGDYILGALNFTSTSTAASEWWHTDGDKYFQIDAEKITVSADTVTKDFSLEDGARIQGTVQNTSGTALEGIKIIIRRYQNFFPAAGKRTKADGSYSVNVIPGDYMIVARNTTQQAYASEVYDGGDGVNYRFGAEQVSLTAGNTTTIDFALDSGYKVSGQITNGINGDPAAGQRIRFDTTENGRGPAFRMRSNKDGEYRIWLPASTYRVRTYGQDSGTITLNSNQVIDFTDEVGNVTVTVKNAAGNGVSQAKVWLTDTNGVFVHNNNTNADGTVTLYSNTSANHLMYVRIDDDHGTDSVAANRYGSVVYSGNPSSATALGSGTQIGVTVGSTTQIGDVELPDAGLLKVNVTSDGTTPVGAYRVRFSTSNVDFSRTGRLTRHRTLGTGSLQLSMPAGTWYIRMSADNNTVCTANVTAGQTTTVNFRTDTDSCS